MILEAAREDPNAGAEHRGPNAVPRLRLNRFSAEEEREGVVRPSGCQQKKAPSRQEKKLELLDLLLCLSRPAATVGSRDDETTIPCGLRLYCAGQSDSYTNRLPMLRELDGPEPRLRTEIRMHHGRRK